MGPDNEGIALLERGKLLNSPHTRLVQALHFLGVMNKGTETIDIPAGSSFECRIDRPFYPEAEACLVSQINFHHTSRNGFHPHVVPAKAVIDLLFRFPDLDKHRLEYRLDRHTAGIDKDGIVGLF